MNPPNETGAEPGSNRAEKQPTPQLNHITVSNSTPHNFAEKIASKRAQRLAAVPGAYRKLFARSYAGKVSPRTAIKCFCLECVGFERAGVTECTAWACPLWPLRPYRTKEATP